MSAPSLLLAHWSTQARTWSVEGFVISTTQPPPTQISLNHCGIGNTGAVAIAKAVAAHGKLARVCCRRRWFDMFGCMPFGLVQLDLTRNHIGSAGAVELAKALAADSALSEVCCPRHVLWLRERRRLGGAVFPLGTAGPWRQHHR